MKRSKTPPAACEEQVRQRVRQHAALFREGDDPVAFWESLCLELADCETAECPPPETRQARMQTLFMSLRTPVLLLNADFEVEVMNPAAVALVEGDRMDAWAEGTHVPVPLAELAPWLAAPLEDHRQESSEAEACRMGVAVSQKHGERHYNVSVSRTSDFSDRHDGFAVVLDDITERVEGERQLAEERNRVAHYLDVVGSMVFALDAAGRVTMVNRTACRVLGYEERALLDRDWVDALVPDEQRDEVRDCLYMIFSGQLEDEDERFHYVTTREGEHRLVQWQGKLLTNEGGLPVGLLLSGTDVTERRAIEEALAEKELWLRNTFVALGEAVLILTPDMKILDANPAAETMFGMTNEELDGLPVGDLHVNPAHYDDFLARARSAFEAGERAVFELPLKRRSGVIFPADHSVSIIDGDDGTTLGVVNVIRDISDRKHAEAELRRSEEKFRRIFESIEEGYMVTDLEGTIMMVNPATCRILQYEAGELVGRSIDSLYRIAEERGGFRKTLEAEGTIRSRQMNALRKDGTTIVIEANAHLVRNHRGEPVAMEGTFRDITRRIEAEKVLREREKQYRAFFENNHAIMLLTDPKTEGIIDANPAASDFYGYPVEVMRTMSMSQINGLSRDEMFEEMRRSMDEGRTYFVVKHLLAGGEVRDVEVYSGPIMVQGVQRLYSVIHDVTQRIRLEQDMKRLATTDALTGANNRHQFFSQAAHEVARAKRYDNPLSVIMLDIDYFKSINDTYGHHAGDVVLKVFSETARTALRVNDVFGRLGGEEFAALLPQTGLEEGLEVAERLRAAFAALSVRVDEAVISFTVSLGVTQVRASDRDMEEVLNRADEALYRAKRMGRNRVVKG
ncbi:PAS domain S-box protein [Pseudodesulfovibrio indicus]|jgi:diguanylate cyclase (GGDEF)-like protein/PAS domain S-box-containing protein|nr:PAS domain S-box protein [Pseudodesulfovibrio indicus]TDT89175.1 PAS domain S-box-containing protein/diguanylate cyclase (GGDEF)-like protein [Pseudodesulfovibrio indicus]